MILKVCGMKYQDNIDQLLALNPDWMGLIFYQKSPRFVSQELKIKRKDIRKIGVFVNAGLEEIIEKKKTYGLDGIQLHGKEEPEFCREVKKLDLLVIKAFSIHDHFDFKKIKKYEAWCDYFLFDTKGINPGGNGIPFDWTLLENYKGEIPFLLSGGIRSELLPALKKFTHPKWIGIDINSGFETKPGLKNINRIKEFKDEFSS
jgi:phosphoribosylanthranilate isomerase